MKAMLLTQRVRKSAEEGFNLGEDAVSIKTIKADLFHFCWKNPLGEEQ
jgi:hypothetical protein